MIRASDLVRRDDGFYEGVQAAIQPSFCFFDGGEGCNHFHLTGYLGWHFTYVADPERIVRKALSIADMWTKNACLENAERAVKEGTDLFGRTRKIMAVSLEELPECVQRNPERYAHLMR